MSSSISLHIEKEFCIAILLKEVKEAILEHLSLKDGNSWIPDSFNFKSVLSFNCRRNYCKSTWKAGDGGMAFPFDGDNSELHCKLDFNPYNSAAFITNHRN